jgi:hypothetical protein
LPGSGPAARFAGAFARKKTWTFRDRPQEDNGRISRANSGPGFLDWATQELYRHEFISIITAALAWDGIARGVIPVPGKDPDEWAWGEDAGMPQMIWSLFELRAIADEQARGIRAPEAAGRAASEIIAKVRRSGY